MVLAAEEDAVAAGLAVREGDAESEVGVAGRPIMLLSKAEPCSTTLHPTGIAEDMAELASATAIEE